VRLPGRYRSLTALQRQIAAPATSGDRGIELQFIDPGKPTQNGHIESFNRRLRDECLDEHAFETFAEADMIIRDWHRFYNFERPHSAIGYKTPMAFIEAYEEQLANQLTAQSSLD
jgi:putative transposase